MRSFSLVGSAAEGGEMARLVSRRTARRMRYMIRTSRGFRISWMERTQPEWPDQGREGLGKLAFFDAACQFLAVIRMNFSAGAAVASGERGCVSSPSASRLPKQHFLGVLTQPRSPLAGNVLAETGVLS